MKKQFVKLFIILLGIFTLTAAKNKEEINTNTDEMATIYVYRKGQFGGAAMNYTIFINDQKVCKLSNNKYLTHQIKAGKVVVEAKSSGKAELIKKRTLFELEVEPGGVYYIKCDIKRSITRTRLEFAEVTKNTGKNDLKDLKTDNCNN